MSFRGILSLVLLSSTARVQSSPFAVTLNDRMSAFSTFAIKILNEEEGASSCSWVTRDK